MNDSAASGTSKKERRAARRAAAVAAQNRARRLRSIRRAGAAVIGLAAIGALIWAVNNDATVDIEAVDTDMAAVGEPLYQASCAECHGTDLRGTDEGPSFLSSVYNPNHHSDESFRMAVQLGAPQHHWPFGDMLPVEGLTDDDISAIIAFVRDQQRVQGFES